MDKKIISVSAFLVLFVLMGASCNFKLPNIENPQESNVKIENKVNQLPASVEQSNLQGKASDADPVVIVPSPASQSSSSPNPTPTASPSSITVNANSGQLNLLINPNPPVKR